MAKHNNGKWAGIFGQVIMYTLFGKQIMRIKPVKVNQSKSSILKNNRSNFTIILHLTQQFSQYAKVGFAPSALNRTAFQEAMSVNMKNYSNALRAEQAEGLDWVELSKGTLSGAKTLNAELSDDYKLTLSWNGTQGLFSNSGNDTVMLLVTSGMGEYTHINLDASKRKEGSVVIDLPADLRDQPLHCFISFKNSKSFPKRGSISNSQYILAT